MTLRLTPKQYRTLIKMAWIASRVSHGSELHDSDTVSQILDLTDELCTMAPDFEATDMFENVEPETDSPPEFSVGEPTAISVRLRPDLEEELLSIIEWFEEFSFWDVLEDRLAMRDISEGRTEAQWNWLPDEEKERLYDKHLDFYFEEFSEAGITNLRIVPPEPGKPRLPKGWSEGSGPSLNSPEERNESSRDEKRTRPVKIIEFPGSDKPPKKPKN